MRPYKIHHVGLLCADPTASTRYYTDVLGLDVLVRFDEPGEFDLAFLTSGRGSLLVELVGPPLSDSEKQFIASRGHALHHIAFETDDVDAAFAELTASGLEAVWSPDDFEFVRHCGVLDLHGNLIEILQETRPLPHPPPTNGDVVCHHVSLLSENWYAAVDFYAKHFGFANPFQYIYDHGGAFVYLADPFFDPGTHNVMLEIIGKPFEEDREFAFAANFGMGLDHAGFVVSDVQAAYQTALSRGSQTHHPPYSEYGTNMCWLKDADGNDLELMMPLPSAEILAALRSGEPHRPNG